MLALKIIGYTLLFFGCFGKFFYYLHQDWLKQKDRKQAIKRLQNPDDELRKELNFWRDYHSENMPELDTILNLSNIKKPDDNRTA